MKSINCKTIQYQKVYTNNTNHVYMASCTFKHFILLLFWCMFHGVIIVWKFSLDAVLCQSRFVSRILAARVNTRYSGHGS